VNELWEGVAPLDNFNKEEEREGALEEDIGVFCGE
jgi:hypothetical protein